MKKNIFKILSVVMTLLLFVGIGISVNAYSLDSNGNLISDNLFNIKNMSSSNVTINSTTNSAVITSNGSTFARAYESITLDSNTYTFKLEYTQTLNYMIFVVRYDNTDHNYEIIDNSNTFETTFTINTTQNVTFSFYLTTTQNVINTLTINNAMLNKGSTAINWEQYGTTWYSENNSQIKQAIGALANTNNIVIDLLENGEIYNSETYSNFFDLPFTTSYGQLTIPVNVFENWNESQHPNAVGNITFNYSNGIVPTNTYGTIYIIRWDYYTEITVTYYDGTSQRYQSTGDSIQVTNPSSTYIKSIKFDTSEDLENYSPITFALDNNYSAGYEQGYTNGNQTGYQNGYTAGSTGKYQEGYNNGYNEGYEQGYEDNPEDKTLYNMVLAIADVPITLFTQIFNFDILGVNIAGFVTSLVSIAIIVWLVKFFI